MKPGPTDRIWTVGPAFLCTILTIPTAAVVAHLFLPREAIWSHLAETLLGSLILNTFFLLAGVTAGTLAVGGSLAWLLGVCEFPGRRHFQWMVFLPFAFPTYVLGFVMLDLFGLTGPVKTWCRAHAPALLPWLPDIASLPGVIFVMVLAFYPYVYLFAREAFKNHTHGAMEAGRSLGLSPFRTFIFAILPLSRPWLAGGLLLVAMETLADFGTVSIFNIDTFTTAIYKAWQGFFSLKTAAQLASYLVLVSLALLAADKFFQSRKKYYEDSVLIGRARRFPLRGLRGILATAYCSVVTILGFALPAAHLLYWAVQSMKRELTAQYWQMVGQTLLTAVLAALLICGTGLFLAASVRFRGRITALLANLSITGYALPGTVLAVGVMIPTAWFDRLFSQAWTWLSGTPAPLLVQGSLFLMLGAYLVRFLAPAFGPLHAEYAKMNPHFDESAQLMGYGKKSILIKVHLPLLRGAVLSGLLIVVIDVMKEMPMTLMTRPQGWQTLATRIYQLTAEGEYHRAALPAILLVLTGLIPVIFLHRMAHKMKPEVNKATPTSP